MWPEITFLAFFSCYCFPTQMYYRPLVLKSLYAPSFACAIPLLWNVCPLPPHPFPNPEKSSSSSGPGLNVAC